MVYVVKFSGIQYPMKSSFTPKKEERVLCEINSEQFMGKVSFQIKGETDFKGIILRPIYDGEKEKIKSLKRDEKYARKFCIKKIKEHDLPMKLLGVDREWDGKRYRFYFVANTRVDFRDLVSDLKSEFRVTIELRQIGVRDYASYLGGYGICGKRFCCRRFFNEKQSVPLEAARDQDIYVDPSKISGPCGRLLCCLSYERDYYKERQKEFPERGETVKTSKGEAIVQHRNIIIGMLTVKYEDDLQEEISIINVESKDGKWVLTGRENE